MKITATINWIYVCFVLAQLTTLASTQNTVITYPAPHSEAVTNDYVVAVNGKPVAVYAAQSQFFQGDYYFASFDFSGKVSIRVTSSQPLDNLQILPARSNVHLERSSPKEVLLEADAPFHISLERNGRIKPLLLFGNPIEIDAPQPGAANVVYFPPGVHRPGKINLTNNQTLYLAGGAVVKGCIQAQGANITIRGRGILAGEESPLYKGPGRYLLDCQDCQNLTVRDLILRNSWSWTIVTWNCDGVAIDNVKVCGSRMISDDALDLVNTQNATVRNCFFRTQDDSIAIKGMAKMTSPCENILIEDCQFWTDVANIFRIGYECETPGMRNINARHIDVLHYSKNHNKPTNYWANAIIWLQPNQNMLMENCHFEDISVRSSGEDVIMLMAKPMSCRYGSFKNPEPGRLRDCSFKDIQVVGERGGFQGLLYMSGDSQQHNVSRLLFDHITYFGQSLTQDSPCVQIGPHVTEITVHK